MINEKKPLVVVLSRNYSTGLGIIRSLGATGEYVIDMVASTMKEGRSIIASSSRYLRKTTEVISSEKQMESAGKIVDALMAYEGTYAGRMVLFPTDDFTAAVIDRSREKLEKVFLMPHVADGQALSVSMLMDKKIQSEMAEKAGLAVPKEWTISLRGEIQIPGDMEYPCFVKPLQSISGYKSEMAACRDGQSLKAHLEKMQQFERERDVLVQEFLEIRQEYDLSGVCLDQEIIIPGIIEKTHVAEHERGVTMAGRLVGKEVLGDLLPKVEEMLRAFRYTGMVDLELNACGDAIYFNEVNLRSGGPNFSYFLNGANLPDIVVKNLLGKPYRREDGELKTFGKTFIYEKTAWEDYINGYMDRNELKAALSGADFTLLEHAEDPQPGKVFRRRIRLSAKKHQMLQLIGKEKKRKNR